MASSPDLGLDLARTRTPLLPLTLILQSGYMTLLAHVLLLKSACKVQAWITQPIKNNQKKQ